MSAWSWFTWGATPTLGEAVQRQPSRQADPADTAKVGGPDPTKAGAHEKPGITASMSPGAAGSTPSGRNTAGDRACPRCDHDVVALPPHTICDECETETADTALVATAERLGDEIGRIGEAAAIEAAAITMRAHVPTWPLPQDALYGALCACGWRGQDHPRHVAEQLAGVGVLGTSAPVATPPVLVDKTGDEWRPVPTVQQYVLSTDASDSRWTRAEIEERWAPITEKPAHPEPRPAVRTGSFAVGRARGLADDASW